MKRIMYIIMLFLLIFILVACSNNTNRLLVKLREFHLTNNTTQRTVSKVTMLNNHFTSLANRLNPNQYFTDEIIEIDFVYSISVETDLSIINFQNINIKTTGIDDVIGNQGVRIITTQEPTDTSFGLMLVGNQYILENEYYFNGKITVPTGLIAGNYTIELISINLGTGSSILFDNSENKDDKIIGFEFFDLPVYQVQFETFGGTHIDRQIVNIRNSAIRPSNPDRSGDRFEGWFIDEKFTTSYGFDSLIENDIILYAKWTNRYMVSFVNPKNHEIYAQQFILDGDLLKTYFPPLQQGAIFVEWVTQEKLSFDFDTFITNDLILYAEWEIYFDFTNYSSSDYVFIYLREGSISASSSYPYLDPTIYGFAIPVPLAEFTTINAQEMSAMEAYYVIYPEYLPSNWFIDEWNWNWRNYPVYLDGVTNRENPYYILKPIE